MYEQENEVTNGWLEQLKMVFGKKVLF